MHRRLSFVAFVALVVSLFLLASSRASAADVPPSPRGFGLTLRAAVAYPLAAGASLGAEVNPWRSVGLELALGGTGPLRKNEDEGGLDALLGARITLDPDSAQRPYVVTGLHFRSVGGTYGGDVSVAHAFLGGYAGVGFELPLSRTFVLRSELIGSITPRLAIGEDTRSDSLRAQLRLNLGITAYF